MLSPIDGKAFMAGPPAVIERAITVKEVAKILAFQRARFGVRSGRKLAAVKYSENRTRIPRVSSHATWAATPQRNSTA